MSIHLSSLRQHKVSVLELWTPEVHTGLKSRSWQGCVSFWRLQRRKSFLAFRIFCRLPAFQGPFCLQRQQWLVKSFWHPFTLTLALLTLTSAFKDLCHYIGSTWIIQDNLPTLRSADLVTGFETWGVNIFGDNILPITSTFWTSNSRGWMLECETSSIAPELGVGGDLGQVIELV